MRWRGDKGLSLPWIPSLQGRGEEEDAGSPIGSGMTRTGGRHLEAPAYLELEALVDRLSARRFLALAFQVQRQAGYAGPAGAQAVGAGRAIREHRARIGGQEAGAEWRGDTIADFGVQTARWGCPVALGSQARGGLPGPEAVYAARRGAPGWGERQGEALAVRLPGARRREPLAPHSL